MSKQSTVSHFDYLYGPVNSRRLGRSLGVDVIPYKTCSMDCVYCECGKTTLKTIERQEYVPTAQIIAELDDFIAIDPNLDYITFAGSGEPTLHAGLGEIIRHIKTNYPSYAVSVLTNGTLLHLPEVRQDLIPADLVVPSFDAATEVSFRKINRPSPQLNLRQMIDGLIQFREEYPGQLWLEVFIIPGINDHEDELAVFKEVIGQIRPDRVQLNSLDRPGAEAWVQPADLEVLEQIQSFLQPLSVEIISRAKLKPIVVTENFTDPLDHIISILERRPSTLKDFGNALNQSENEIRQILNTLLANGRIRVKKLARAEFFYLPR